jgi:hypothetical protein
MQYSFPSWCPACASEVPSIRLKIQNFESLYTCTDLWHEEAAKKELLREPSGCGTVIITGGNQH